MLGCVEEDTVEGVDCCVYGGGRGKGLELGLREGSERRPVGTSKISVCTAGADGGESSTKETVIGRWSEFNRWWTCQSTAVARWAEIKEMSGEEGTGSGWVGTGPLRTTSELQSMVAAIVSPRAAARSQLVLENQASLWALRSPSTNVSASVESKGDRVSSERVWPGQLDAGGR